MILVVKVLYVALIPSAIQVCVGGKQLNMLEAIIQLVII